MNTYAIWVDLKPGERDMEFASAVRAYLDWLSVRELIAGSRIARRKFGFGPEGLGEWHIEIHFHDLAQMDRTFAEVAKRAGDLEQLHGEVYRRVCNFRSGLYRDFPDPEREGP